MSGVELKPCGSTDASEANILLPLGKSTVGRGPLLGIADKRVSRNHGLMEVEDGKIKIMPTHTNPTFYQAKGDSKLGLLEKDVWQTLQDGDKVGLTPDQHIFEVIIHDRPINTSTQSLKTSMIESSPEKTPQKAANTEDSNAVKTDDDKKVEGQQNGDDKNVDEDRSTEDEEQKEEKSEKKTVADEKPQEKEAKEESKDDEDTNGMGDESADSDSQDKEKVETVKLEDGKEVALPVQKERTLPDWMDTEAEEKVPAAKADTTAPGSPRGRGRPKKDGTPAKPATQSPKSSQEVEGETPPKKGRGRPKGASSKPKGRGRGRPPKRSVDEEQDEALSPDGEGLNRETKKTKYTDEYYEEGEGEEEEEAKVVFKDDDDWMLSEEEVESDISDWEDSQRSHKSHKAKPKAKKSPGKKGRRGRPAKNARTPTRKALARGKKKSKSYFTDSEEDFFTDDDEIYVPKPTKRTAGRGASSQSQESVGSGDGDDNDHRPKKATPKAKKKATPVKKAAKKQKKKKKKEPCEYGAECYRKNPSHFKEFCHPGDADYKSPHSSEKEEEEAAEPKEPKEEEEKEECPFGAECYRTNKSHLKQYRHQPPPVANRPKREAAQKKAVVIQGDRSSLLHSGVSDDDGAPNTYDDNDSFLDDAIMGSDQEGDKEKGTKSDDSDWSPGAVEEKGAKKATKVH